MIECLKCLISSNLKDKVLENNKMAKPQFTPAQKLIIQNIMSYLALFLSDRNSSTNGVIDIAGTNKQIVFKIELKTKEPQ